MILQSHTILFVEEFYLHDPIRIVIAKTLANIVAFRCSASAVLTQVKDLALKHRLHVSSIISDWLGLRDTERRKAAAQHRKLSGDRISFKTKLNNECMAFPLFLITYYKHQKPAFI